MTRVAPGPRGSNAGWHAGGSRLARVVCWAAAALALPALHGCTGEVPIAHVPTSCAGASDYQTIRLAAGETRILSLGSGETLENVLIDASAPGSDVRIVANGDGWAIRNVGFAGAAQLDGSSGGFSNRILARGNGVIDTVYLGDGVAPGVSKGAIGIPHDHSGHIEIRRCHVAGWSSTALHAASMARIRPPGSTDGGGGTVALRSSYFRDNNIAHVNVASDGTVVEDTIIHNTNAVPPHPVSSGGLTDVVNSRGIWTAYGDPMQVVTVRRTHIDVTEDNTNGAASAAVSSIDSEYGDCSIVRIVDSQVRGQLVGEFVETRDVGDSPDASIPAGVPTSPEQAASGAVDCSDAS